MPNMKRFALGQYLLSVAQLWIAMDYDLDEQFLCHSAMEEAWSKEPQLHLRRTLRQSAALSRGNISLDPDESQVVSKQTQLPRRLLMVDELWMWVLDERTIITCFPRRWGRNKPDASGVSHGLRETLLRMGGEIQSVYHLALLVMDQCSKVFFDASAPLDDRPQVMDFFADAIRTVTDNAMGFLKSMELGKDTSTRFCFNLRPEQTLLIEAQGISEELAIITDLFKQQEIVVSDLLVYLSRRREQAEIGSRSHATRTAVSKGKETGPVLVSQAMTAADVEETEDILRKIQDRGAEVRGLEGAVEVAIDQVRNLLDLKQRQVGIIEAETALRRTHEAATQSRVISAFAAAAFFFLPLCFLAALFGMQSCDSAGDSCMDRGQQVGLTVGVSATVFVVLASMTFSTLVRTAFIRIPMTYLWRNMGLKRAWEWQNRRVLEESVKRSRETAQKRSVGQSWVIRERKDPEDELHEKMTRLEAEAMSNIRKRTGARESSRIGAEMV
ncbi:hypothetical protein F5883DRAFT_687175 [Diaporthe sp. PMI_573]|nr:hypothetical protein F5883DRAFT_687175 [Diaporthaceae sp. PMI_573]